MSSRPTITCGADIVYNYGGPYSVVLDVNSEPELSDPAFTWQIMSVPDGSAVLTGKNGDFNDGYAIGIKSPVFITEENIEGTYVFRCIARNQFGTSDITSLAQQNIIIKSEKMGTTYLNNYMWGWHDYNNQNILKLKDAWPPTIEELNSNLVTETIDTVSNTRSPSGAAGGDLSGTYPSPTVSKLQNTSLNISGISDGQFVVWSEDNNEWGFIDEAEAFTDLTDSPSSHSGSAGYALVVNSGENSLTYYDINTSPKQNWPLTNSINSTTVNIVAQPGRSNILKLMLSDGKFYEAAAPLVLDPADSGLLGRDASDSGSYYQLHIYAVPSGVEGQMSFVCSENHLLINGQNPGNYSINKYIGSFLLKTDDTVLPFIQTGKWFNYLDYSDPTLTMVYSEEIWEQKVNSTANSGSTTTLTDTSQLWTVNEWAGRGCFIYQGANVNLTRTIISNTSNTLTFEEAFPYTISNGDKYVVDERWTWHKMDGTSMTNFTSFDASQRFPIAFSDQVIIRGSGDLDEGNDVDVCVAGGDPPKFYPPRGSSSLDSTAGQSWFITGEQKRGSTSGINNQGMNIEEIFPIIDSSLSFWVETSTNSQARPVQWYISLRGYRNPLWGDRYID